jgi:hypothetical protein
MDFVLRHASQAGGPFLLVRGGWFAVDGLRSFQNKGFEKIAVPHCFFMATQTYCAAMSLRMGAAACPEQGRTGHAAAVRVARLPGEGKYLPN